MTGSDFFELAERFRSADQPEVIAQLGDELGRVVSGSALTESAKTAAATAESN